ncbi:MAG: ATP-binding protein [Planctomycetales bacterium]
MADRSRLLGHAVAVAIVVAATIVRLPFDAHFGDRVPFITYFVAVAAAAWYGGRGPAILATILSGFAACYLFLPPRGDLLPQDAAQWVYLATFLAFGGVIAFIGGTMRQAQRRAEESARQFADERERFFVTLSSIGDGVIATDAEGRVTFVNAVAADLIGWRPDDAAGRPIESVFRIFNEQTREAAENPAAKALRLGRVVGLANHTLLVARDGAERAIDDSAAPIRDKDGRTIGVILVFRDVGKARRLKRERDRLAAIVESSEDAVLGMTFELVATHWNEGARNLFGFTADEVIGRPLAETILPEDRVDELRAVHERVRRGKRVDPFETVRTCQDGRRIDVSIRISPIRDEDGRIVGASAIDRDITNQKESERTLSEGEERLRLALEAGRMGTWQWSVASGEVIWSPGLERIHGREVGTFAGTFEAYQQDIHPEDRDRVLDTIRRSIEERREHHLEYRIVWPDGSVHWLEARGKLFLDDQGRPQKLLGVCADVSEAKRHEAILRFLADASKSLSALVDYRSTLQSVARLAVPDFADWCAVDILDDEGRVERLAVAHVDPEKVEFAKRLQEEYPSDPDAPRGVHHVLRTGEPEFVAEIDDELVRQAAQDEEQLQIIRELGLASYIAVPLKAHDRTLGVLTFVTAESGRRYRPDDLAVAEDLARRATIAIENARLYQEVREAGRRKDEFLAMLAHELRNPLAPIRSGLDILGMEPNGQQETVELMQQQVEHLVRLVDDLLDVSRIMRGKVELRRQPTRIATIVQRAAEAVQWSIESQEQELTLDIPDDTIVVDADPVRLVQVIENLLNNASKYTDRGGHISVSAERRGGTVAVRVRDDGIGIDPELLPRIFDLFTQSTRSLDRAQGGLGIGLTLVRSLVEGHGGHVAAHSAGAGTGSEFVVTLPISDAVPLPEGAAPGPRSTATRRVLVVDDNVGAVRMLSLLLQRLGEHEVETAHDGPTALRKLAEFRPEIVLLDIGLPGMDGYEVAARVRGNPEFDDVLLVALTGYGQDEDRRKSRRVGFDEHLVKPPALDQIAQILTRTAPGTRTAASRHTVPRAFVNSRPANASAGSTDPGRRDARLLPEREKVGAFFRSLAHEIGNSIVPIRLMLELLKRPNLDAETVASVTDMLDQHLPSMNQLVEDLRRIGRIASGSLALRRANVEPQALVDAAVVAVAPQLEERRQQLDSTVPDALPELTGDAEFLQQALAELLRNASQFSPSESRISLHVEERAGTLVFRVRNPGGGIPPELLPHVFELFVRGEQRLDAAAGHWGIGLTFVRQVVEKHGGRVDVHAPAGATECEFAVRLPTAAQVAPAPAEEVSPHSAEISSG